MVIFLIFTFICEQFAANRYALYYILLYIPSKFYHSYFSSPPPPPPQETTLREGRFQIWQLTCLPLKTLGTLILLMLYRISSHLFKGVDKLYIDVDESIQCQMQSRLS